MERSRKIESKISGNKMRWFNSLTFTEEEITLQRRKRGPERVNNFPKTTALERSNIRMEIWISCLESNVLLSLSPVILGASSFCADCCGSCMCRSCKS